VITMEDWISIRNIKSKNPDMSHRAIGRIMHVNKNTVKRALENEYYPQYNRKTKSNKDIDQFADYIYESLIVKKLQGSRILSDIKSKGYKGSKSAFYRYIKKTEPKEQRTFHPYETAPGEQAQFDWSPYSVIINGIITKVYVFSYILGYSRFRVYEAALSQTLGSTLEALENSIIETSGTVERIQTDNATCFITNASRENLQWNSNYLQFCGHYSIKATRSLPKHPWSKGKVERPFSFLEEHFIKGNEFESFEEFYIKLKKFQEEVNNRVHATTKQKPVFLFKQELICLGKLPDNKFIGIKEQVRKVTLDCLISFEGNRYSVPYLFATKEVWLKVSKGRSLQIYSSQNKLIAEHILSLEKGKVIINEDHYKNHIIERGNWSRLFENFNTLFPDYLWFAENLKIQKRINPSYHLTQILEMTKYYSIEDLKNAFSVSKQYNVYTFMFIKAHLENNSQVKLIEPCPIDIKILEPIESIDINRPLSDYKLTYY
jgi:transposase